MLLRIKQWETKYLREFDEVNRGVISEEHLYRNLSAMYYSYVVETEIEPFVIRYGRDGGFCICANSHVGVIVFDDLVLYIESMIPDLSLGKILYLQSQAENISSSSTTKQVLAQNLNDEESITAIDYFVISLINVIEDIKQNGLLSELATMKQESNRIIGRLDVSTQIKKYPAYDKFCVENTMNSNNILVNQVIRRAVVKAKELTSLKWIRPLLSDADAFFQNADMIEDLAIEDFPKLEDFTSIKRDDYEKALRFSKYILYGYDPLEGDTNSFFPEFMLDMNEVFEFYVTVGLKRIFKSGFDNKVCFTLGVGPEDISIERKNIELDGFYDNGDKRVVLDTKNKYRTILDRDIPDFIAANPDIYQQYYYASRVNANSIILVYPSSKKRTAPIGTYQLNFEGNKDVTMYFWALHITGTPRENKQALINLAQFIEEL